MKKLLVLVILISACNAEKEKSAVATYFNTTKLPAAIMGSVDKEGKMTWYAFGPSRWGGTDTVKADNIFRIYSMTKAIASVGAMQLVEKGQLTLDQPLNVLMPEMDSIPVFNGDELVYRHDTITLRHLLTHTAGFGYKFTSSKLASFKPEKWKFRDDPRLFKSGRGWNYGTNTDWVGKVIEKVSGKNLETYLRENVTGPLKMNSTWFNVPAELQDKIVSWGQRDSTGFKEFPRVPTEPVTVYSAGGGLFGSPSDYLRFLNCMLNKGELDGVRIIKAETIDLMLKDNLPTDVNLQFGGTREGANDPTDRWGLAWALEASPDETVRPDGVAYWAGAANSYYTLDTKDGIAVVYFSNFFPFNDKEAYGLYREFEKEVLPQR